MKPQQQQEKLKLVSFLVQKQRRVNLSQQMLQLLA
jgi:hypothetical protein